MPKLVAYRKQRLESGAFLIELMAALLISSLIAIALCDSIGQYMRLTTTTEGREISAIIAREILERVKNIPFDASCLDETAGPPYELLINDFDPNPGNLPAELARPLLLDTTNMQYSTQLADTTSAYHKFKGRATLKISPGPINPSTNAKTLGTKTVTIHVYWSEPNSTGQRDLELNSVLYRYGLQHHGS